jgi:hypothetical protein
MSRAEVWDVAEDVAEIVRERKTLRVRVRRLEAQLKRVETENRRLRVIVEGTRQQLRRHPADRGDGSTSPPPRSKTQSGRSQPRPDW